MTGGWHPDPMHRHQQRWWDGASWTEHVTDDGAPGVDPLDAPVPGPVPAPAAAPTVSTGPPVAVTSGHVRGPDRRRNASIAAGVAVVAAVVLAFVVLTSDGDETVTPADDTTATVTPAEVFSSVQPVTTVATTPPTTAPPTTEVATTVAPTTQPTLPATTAPPPPPSTVVVATEAALLGVLPAAEIPADWVPPPEGATWTGGEPSSGPYVGMCSGDSDDGRAVAAGVSAVAGEGWYELPSGGWYELRLYGFPSPADAASFMNMTRLQATACPAGNSFQLPEGQGPGRFDGFSDGDPPVVWNLSEQIYEADVVVPAVDDTIQIVWITTFATTENRVAYSGSQTVAFQYEQFGSVVAVHAIDSWHDFVGFGSGGSTYVADPVDVIGVAEAFRPGLIDRLRTASLI